MDKKSLARLSPAGLYGDQQFFEGCLSEGYTEFVYGGTSEVVGDIRLVGMFACVHPDGRVATIETYKSYADYATVRGQSRRTYETFALFEEEVRKYRVNVTIRMSLAELVEEGRKVFA